MKLHQSIKTKNTIRLFNGKYKYKIVLLSKAASWFRGGDLEATKKSFAAAQDSNILWVKKLSAYDLDYAFKLIVALAQVNKDYVIRVENPYINFYTNTPADIEKLSKIDSTSVKYVSFPAPGNETVLDDKKIIVKTLDYSYKVTMGRTNQNFSNFINWCKGKEDRIRLTKSSIKHLSKDASWGGYYFYVKDDKTLTMVKMFLGVFVQSVESVIKK